MAQWVRITINQIISVINMDFAYSKKVSSTLSAPLPPLMSSYCHELF